MTKQITITVKGMMCEHCEKRVVEAANSIEGVKKALANHKEELVSLEIDTLVEDEKSIIDEVKLAINKAGYETV